MKNTIRINDVDYSSKLILQLEKDNYFRNYYLLYTEQGQVLYLKESNEPGEDPEAFLILKNWEDVTCDLNKLEIEELTELRKYWWESASALNFYNQLFIHEDIKDKLHEITSQINDVHTNQNAHSEIDAIQLSDLKYMEQCA